MENGLKLVFCDSVHQADRPGRQHPTFWPQDGQVIAGQMTQNPLDHRRGFDTRDDLDRSTALRTDFDLDLKDS